MWMMALTPSLEEVRTNCQQAVSVQRSDYLKRWHDSFASTITQQLAINIESQRLARGIEQ